MMITAPNEVYAPSEELAARAVALWTDPPPEREDFVEGARATVHDMALIATKALPMFFQEGAAMNPHLAFARMLAVQHRWGCECERAFAHIPDPVLRRERRRRQQQMLKLAEMSLREQGLLA